MPSSAKPLQGVSIDAIDRLSDPLASTSSIDPLVSLLALAYHQQVGPEGDRLASLMHTMTGSSSSSSSSAPPHSQELVMTFIEFLSPILGGLAGLSDFSDAVDAVSNPDGFCDFWTLNGQNLIRDVVAGDGHGGSPIPAVSFLDAYVEDTSRRVALGLESGALSLVPAEAKPGDELWQECASSPTLVRRRSPNGGWNVIGKALIHRQ
ncbi:hypothetical protein L249_0078 [Ophiocordyceps polyrhachis-furcata BCC 54312]|uniref:Uncharacterized protein n=1 Tax=Ophiocordyceps polyrhachis-furcata BCC 54312 TaxID=1330021 RepID=A0A367LF36_9HYPO|nr:hypothetical protein L249_0078 [Ophiocordyceps polyrhachis-furcata BCC 54312]